LCSFKKIVQFLHLFWDCRELEVWCCILWSEF
jgi:hypothetical protein